MSDERLSHLAMLSVHSRRAKCLDLEQVPNCRMQLRYAQLLSDLIPQLNVFLLQTETGKII